VRLVGLNNTVHLPFFLSLFSHSSFSILIFLCIIRKLYEEPSEKLEFCDRDGIENGEGNRVL